MRTITMEEQVTKIRDLVYDIRTALCWPLKEGLKEGDTSTSSMVDSFLKTDQLTAYQKTERLNKVWEASDEILDIMGGKWDRLTPPEIHHRKAHIQHLAIRPEANDLQ